MKKGCYIYPISVDNNKYLESSGVYKKILSQCDILSKYFDIKLALVNYSPKKNFTQFLLKRLPLSASAHIWKYNTEYDLLDFIYIRRALHDNSLIKFIKEIKKNNPKIKILYEFPTYPYEKEMVGLKNLPFVLKDRYFRSFLYQYIDIGITYSLHKKILNIPTINLMNGIDFSKIRISKHKINSDKINIIEVSTASFSHGYERLLRGLGNYYKNNGSRNIIFHMVGEGVEIPYYKKLVDQYRIENHVVFHGNKSGNDLDSLFDICVLGVDALGCHRKNCNISSSLKSREYGAKGIPIIASCKIDYIDDSYKYFLRLPSNESIINIDKILEFYDSIYKNQRDFNYVSNEIRNYAMKRCDIGITMKPVVDYLMNNR